MIIVGRVGVVCEVHNAYGQRNERETALLNSSIPLEQYAGHIARSALGGASDEERNRDHRGHSFLGVHFSTRLRGLLFPNVLANTSACIVI